MTSEEEFERRVVAFEEGYMAFIEGIQANPYGTRTRFKSDITPHMRTRNDQYFLRGREWQAGWDRAYFDNLQRQAARVEA